MIKNLLHIPNFFYSQIIKNQPNLNYILFFLLTLSTVAILHAFIKDQMINITGILMILVVSLFIYTFFKKKYKKKINYISKKYRNFTNSHILDKLCKSKQKNKKVCNQYKISKKNYNKINDILLKQYKI